MSDINEAVALDSDFGRSIGFTSDRFVDGSYLWRDGDRVMISFIWSRERKRGYLSDLFRNIESMGFRVAVPTPLGLMKEILLRKGFVMHVEESDEMGPVEVWERPAVQPVP